MIRPRIPLAVASVASVAAPVATAASLGPDHLRTWLVVAGVLAIVASIQSVAADPADLTAALLLAALPVLSLLAEGSPTWMIGPLSALLLMAGELSALSWSCRGSEVMTAVHRRRLLNIVPLAALGLGGALGVPAIGSQPLGFGTFTIGLVAVTLAAVGWLLFWRHPQARP